MGMASWALDNLWLVAGGSLAISFLLHFVIVWVFKNSGKKTESYKDKTND